MNSSFSKLAGFFAGVFLVGFSVTALILTRSPSRTNPAVAGVVAPGLRIERLPSVREFSDVVQIPGTNKVLIVEDETKDSLLMISLGLPGDTDGPVEEVPLPDGFYLKDMEGVAADERGFVYAVSSHSLNSEGKPRRGGALVRMKWEEPGRLTRAETVADLRPWLESEIPEIDAVKNLQADDGGLNIEGLAFDPDDNRLFLGLRGPLFGNRPALIPIRLKSPDGPFNRQTMELQPPIILEGITLGCGIRSISYDNAERAFWLISGGSTKAGKNRFQAWFWRKDTREAQPSSISFKKKIGTWATSYKLHPEGICAVRISPERGERAFLFVVTDGSPYYLKMDMYPKF